MKLLRTIRLDASDTFIFPAAADPGDWAISGSFAFDGAPPNLTGRALAAFRGGFLGIPSLGWSTLAQVVEIKAEDRHAAIEMLARCLVERYDAPDLDTARAAATEEIDFAASLCDHPADTLIAVRRTAEADAIREAFRTLKPRGDNRGWHAFSFLEARDDEPVDEVDLTGLARGDEQ
ncbi:MAG TPA: DUF6505 family protein [Stellaceae bacterium]|nr:DUF6505 family protein [Stellaceae bacterium]